MAGRRASTKTKSTTKRRRPSTTGKVKNVPADQTNWRRRLQQAKIKFDDEAKEVYLTTLADCGLKGEAARMAGVCQATVGNHLENDEEFAEAVKEAIEEYSDKISATVRRRGSEGILEPVYQKGARVIDYLLNEDGSVAKDPETGEPVLVPATIRKFSDRMLELEAKRVNPGYRDKTQVDMDVTGGVLLVRPQFTPEEEDAEADRANAEARERRRLQHQQPPT